ncbi:MAG: hypothetical protein E7052_10195 [Lentisphaerae bacterium]|nr:hypothetical protein [Lentisphaerota bacterium]
MNKYYVYVQNTVSGPFTLDVIVKMLIEGSISNNTQISCGKGTPWQLISDRPEILHAVSQWQAPASTQAEQPIKVIPVQAVAAQARQPVQQNPTNQQIPVVTVQAVPVKAQPVQLQEETAVFYCPRCNQKYEGESSWLGRDVICTTCNEIFVAGSTELKPSPDSVSDEQEYISWENSTGDIICPHCWLHFGSEQLLYIASHPSLTGDPVLGSLAQKRFSPTNFNALGQALDAMSYACTDVACPRCHLKIPQTLIEEKSLYFSIVGTHSCGKSYYLATLIHQLRHKLANEFACSLLDVDPEMNMVIDSYEETLFRPVKVNEVAVLPKTQREGEKFVNTVVMGNMPVNLPKPFVFELKHQQRQAGAEDCNIVFYDNAGEHFQPGGDDVTNPGTRHLACSNGIIFIFDPVNDAVMRQNCNDQDPQLASDVNVYDQSKLMSEMVSRIRRHCNLNTNEKCTIPLVIGVGKYDTWRHLLSRDIADLDTISYNDTDFSAVWNRNTVMDVSFELRNLMLQYAPSLVNTAEGFFEKVYFVPFSNFGCLATLDSTGQAGVIPNQIKPLWPEQLFLTLMAENGKLPVSTTAGAANQMPTRIIDDFIVFTHPGNNSVVRLPWFYSQSVITVDGQTWQLPAHPKAIQQQQPQQAADPERFINDDLWS